MFYVLTQKDAYLKNIFIPTEYLIINIIRLDKKTRQKSKLIHMKLAYRVIKD